MDKMYRNISSYRVMKFLGRENKIDCLISEGMWKIEKYMRGREVQENGETFGTFSSNAM